MVACSTCAGVEDVRRDGFEVVETVLEDVIEVGYAVLDKPAPADSGHEAGAEPAVICPDSFGHLADTSSKNLMNHLPRKAISSVPKLASWTPFTFVVDSLLVRAADYGVCHRD